MTTDRKRGMKGDKYFQTRTVGQYGYGDGSFCTVGCLGDWWAKHGTRAIDHFGRLHEPIRLAHENAWVKEYDYEYINNTSVYTHHFKNKLTNERIPLTLAQYDDTNYTIERARQTERIERITT